MGVSSDLVSSQDMATVRRYVDEPTEATYDDTLLKQIIATYPLLDILGQDAMILSTSTTPPTFADNPDWMPAFDLHYAAGEIWQEKAGVVAQDFDYKADKADFSRSQKQEQFMVQSRHHMSRRVPGTIKLVS